MDFNYRVKVMGYTAEQLLAMGHAINTYECAAGEHWVIGPSRSWIDEKIKSQKLTIIGQPEAIRS